jgi:hypothetical protein
MPSRYDRMHGSALHNSTCGLQLVPKQSAGPPPAGASTDSLLALAHLRAALVPNSKEVIKCTVVDASPLILLNVGTGHGVGFPTASLPIGKDADIVACRNERASASQCIEETRSDMCVAQCDAYMRCRLLFLVMMKPQEFRL